MNTTPRSRTQLLQSIIDLLEEFPAQKPRRCEGCGYSLKFVSVHFHLSGTGMNWNVSLPFCPVCDRDNVEHMPFRETIH